MSSAKKVIGVEIKAPKHHTFADLSEYMLTHHQIGFSRSADSTAVISYLCIQIDMLKERIDRLEQTEKEQKNEVEIG